MENLKTDRLFCNPTDHKSLQKLREEHAEFQAHVRGIDSDQILKYIIYAYDKESELRDEFPNIHQRKAQAALLAGFKLKKNRFPDTVEDMLLGRLKPVNIMIVKYILLRSDPDLLALETYMDIFTKQSIATLSQVSDPKEYKDVLANTEVLRKKISELTNNIFGGEDVAAIKREIYGQLEQKRSAIRPEQIAERIEKGEEPIEEDIYGDWKPEPIKLVKSEEQIYKGE